MFLISFIVSRCMVVFINTSIFISFISSKIKNKHCQKIRRKNERYPSNYRDTAWKYLGNSEVQHLFLKTEPLKAHILKCAQFKKRRWIVESYVKVRRTTPKLLTTYPEWTITGTAKTDFTTKGNHIQNCINRQVCTGIIIMLLIKLSPHGLKTIICPCK